MKVDNKPLTSEEIFDIMEKEKNIRRMQLEKQIMKLTEKCRKDDVIYVLASLINMLTK